jgi:hypothetical protein
MEACMLAPARLSSLRLLVAAAALAVSAPALAQQPQPDPCREDGRSDRPGHCEVREQVLPAPGGTLTVDAAPNGGIKVEGAQRSDVRLRARVVAHADSVQEAKALASQVRVLTDGGRIRAEGPRAPDGSGWSVNFELVVPAQTALDLHSTNGGIGLTGLQGHVVFNTTNGGISLTDVNGDVRGSTTNGGVHVVLAGDGWHGEGLDVETHNGGVRLEVPDGYSAHLDAGTQNGGVRVGFPVTVQGHVGRTVETDLGRGGAHLHVRTVNGGVTVDRRD